MTRLSIFLTFFFGIFLTGCQPQEKEKEKAIDITAFKVTAQTIPAEFEYVGVARSSQPVEIRARVESYLDKIDYLEGSMVEVGQLLFQLDPKQFQASLAEAEGELARQRAILWRAKRSLERIEPLYEKNAASRRDLDNAIAQVLASEASVIEAEANVFQAELNLSYTFIASPIKGMAGKANFREGNLITPTVNGLLTTVSIIDPIWINFSVSDQELLSGRRERQAQTLILPENLNFTVKLILADGTQFPYSGEVNFTSPTLDPETGTLMVRATFPNPDSWILPGQFVQAIVSGAMRPNAIFVPQQSVFQGTKGMFVFVIDKDNRISSRPVEVGSWYKNFWIIQKGLEENELVVADGINKVQDGSLVHILSVTDPGGTTK